MVIQMLFTSCYTVIGYLGQSQNLTKFHLLVAYALINLLFCRGMQRRDLLVRRYWRREDDGTYGT